MSERINTSLDKSIKENAEIGQALADHDKQFGERCPFCKAAPMGVHSTCCINNPWYHKDTRTTATATTYRWMEE